MTKLKVEGPHCKAQKAGQVQIHIFDIHWGHKIPFMEKHNQSCGLHLEIVDGKQYIYDFEFQDGTDAPTGLGNKKINKK